MWRGRAIGYACAAWALGAIMLAIFSGVGGCMDLGGLNRQIEDNQKAVGKSTQAIGANEQAVAGATEKINAIGDAVGKTTERLKANGDALEQVTREILENVRQLGRDQRGDRAQCGSRETEHSVGGGECQGGGGQQ